MRMKRRDALKLAGTAALTAGFAGSAAAADDKATAPPKGPKIGPPPQDENGAEEELGVSDMIGLQLRVIKPGQVVTLEYNDSRLTITVDKNNVITDIKIG